MDRSAHDCGYCVVINFLTPGSSAQAAETKQPSLSKTSLEILEGKNYSLNVQNKIAGSSYGWFSKYPEIATINQKGTVVGVKQGETIVTCMKISLITYEFDVTNAVVGSSITFNMQDSNWKTHTQTFQLTGDGTYSATFYLSGAEGIANMGWFVTDPNNTAVATLTKVIVNKTYELTYGAVLKLNSSSECSLPNIWSGMADGQILAQGTDCK